MKYTRLRVWFIFFIIVGTIGLMLYFAASQPDRYISSSPITDSLITSTYPDLYEAIAAREAEQLKPFLTSEGEAVREQAWRALAVTSVDSLSPLIDLAVEQNTEVAWFAISLHDISENRLRELEELWTENSSLRKGIATVLGRQGDEQSLSFLLDQLDSEVAGTFPFALAVGRLVTRFDITQNQQIAILQKAFETNDEKVLGAYLYGWYRGPEQALTPVAQDTLFTRWRLFGVGLSTRIDQYVNKILKERTTSTITLSYNSEQWLGDEVQLAIELAQSLDDIELNRERALAAKILLVHPNPLVKKQTLESLSGKIEQGDVLFEFIRESMVGDSTLANAAWLQALETVSQGDESLASEHAKRLDEIPEENSYFTSGVLAIYEDILSPEEYLEKIEGFIAKEEPIYAIEALRSLNLYWENLPDDEREQPLIEKVRELTFRALDSGDRGIAYFVQPLLLKEDLFYESDFEQINEKLSAFSLPGDIEVYQRFGVLYKKRFEEQARGVIDSLAALNYAPLNRSLAEAGWNVEVPEASQTDFRMPDWERLWELGRHPVLTMVTEKGNIEIRMNTLTAPATISAIDSLSRAGAYEGVPFHRVVPNFVIQGGDIERQDGFGGPDFIIPTEPSEEGFIRGAAGIASAGPDTEGSQYFFMHQWSPHLNGHYTRFGIVVEGMDVVDRIVPGDEVLNTTWYSLE